MKILITGSSGRIGRAIFVRLVRNHDVIGFDRVPSSTASFVGDIADRELLNSALKNVDALIHTAALHAPQVGFFSEQEFERVNLQATSILFKCAIAAGVRRFVFTSTTALYGKASCHLDRAAWIDESVHPIPMTVYHRTKVAAEEVLESLSLKHGVAITVIRMSRCFPETAPIMAVFRLHRGVDARDVASAHELAVLKFDQGFRRYVISGATPFLPDDLALLQRDAPTVLRVRAPGLVEDFAQRNWSLPQSIDRVYCSNRAIQELNWSPKFGYQEIIKLLDTESSEVLPENPQFNSNYNTE